MKKGIITLGALTMAVVATSYSVSGTYAKYVSEIDLADEARVAKWNIDLSDSTEKELNLFQESYDYVYVDGENGEKTNTAVVRSLADAEGNLSRVVAPGTKGQYTFALTGAIETNYKITLTVNGENTVRKSYTAAEGSGEVSIYDPIKFYLSESDQVNIDEVNESDLLTFEQLKEELGKLYSGESGKVYAPGVVSSESHTIYWKWDFEGNDKLDTELGENAENHKINLSIKITAEQTREAATPEAPTPTV